MRTVKEERRGKKEKKKRERRKEETDKSSEKREKKGVKREGRWEREQKLARLMLTFLHPKIYRLARLFVTETAV